MKWLNQEEYSTLVEETHPSFKLGDFTKDKYKWMLLEKIRILKNKQKNTQLLSTKLAHFS